MARMHAVQTAKVQHCTSAVRLLQSLAFDSSDPETCLSLLTRPLQFASRLLVKLTGLGEDCAGASVQQPRTRKCTAQVLIVDVTDTHK